MGLDKPNFYTPKEVKNKILEEFTSNDLFSNKEYNSNDFIENNKFTLINIWSSWCVPCRSEHYELMDLNKKTNLNIVGLNYKDKKNNAQKFLNELGNPYDVVLKDIDGTDSIFLGAYGVPETFVIDREGIIRYKHIGPVDQKVLSDVILPLVSDLKG